MVLPERSSYGHPFAGLQWERQFEEALLELGVEKIPKWECVFVHRKQEFLLSVYVDDIKIVGKKQNMTPMWKMMQNVNIGEPTSFLDHAYLGCNQLECKPNETIIAHYTKMFESRISLGAKGNWDGKNLTRKLWRDLTTWKDMPQNASNDTVNKRIRKWSNCTKFQALAWMIINSDRKNSNLLENCQEFARKLL